jgi:hypothetical protein
MPPTRRTTRTSRGAGLEGAYTEHDEPDAYVWFKDPPLSGRRRAARKPRASTSTSPPMSSAAGSLDTGTDAIESSVTGSAVTVAPAASAETVATTASAYAVTSPADAEEVAAVLHPKSSAADVSAPAGLVATLSPAAALASSPAPAHEVKPLMPWDLLNGLLGLGHAPPSPPPSPGPCHAPYPGPAWDPDSWSYYDPTAADPFTRHPELGFQDPFWWNPLRAPRRVPWAADVHPWTADAAFRALEAEHAGRAGWVIFMYVDTDGARTYRSIPSDVFVEGEPHMEPESYENFVNWLKKTGYGGFGRDYTEEAQNALAVQGAAC